MIIVPDEEFHDRLKPHLHEHLQQVLDKHAPKQTRRVRLVNASEASASFTLSKHDDDATGQDERIVLTPIEAADGLERLAVILVGLDVPDLAEVTACEPDPLAEHASP